MFISESIVIQSCYVKELTLLGNVDNPTVRRIEHGRNRSEEQVCLELLEHTVRCDHVTKQTEAVVGLCPSNIHELVTESVEIRLSRISLRMKRKGLPAGRRTTVPSAQPRISVTVPSKRLLCSTSSTISIGERPLRSTTDFKNIALFGP